MATFAEDRLARLALIIVPISIVSLGIGASVLSPAVVGQVAGAIAAWLSLSLPVGVLIGHCVLGED